MSLQLRAVVADRDFDVELAVADGETVAVLGPNGAGKSTVLAAVAGIVGLDHGRVVLDDDVLVDTATGTWRPPHARGTALLAQDALLFPHLSVLDNVGFGPRSAGRTRAASRDDARGWLAEVGAEHLADRRADSLSGGQAQRVAMARALAADPRVLLLDEPMAALDVTVVPELRLVLRRVLADRTTVLVTHDVLDALLLADRVVVVEAGRIVEDGPATRVLTAPRSTFGARIAGLNLLRGSVRSAGVVTPQGLRVEGLTDTALPEGSSAVAVFDPAAVSVHLERPAGSPRNVFADVVTELEPRGAQVRVRTATLSADVSVASVAALGLVPGLPVHLAVKAAEVALHPA